MASKLAQNWTNFIVADELGGDFDRIWRSSPEIALKLADKITCVLHKASKDQIG